MAVVDRWHHARPTADTPRCEHDKVPTADHGRGDRWLARWRDPSGRQRKQSFARKADAERHLTAIMRELHRGNYIDPGDGRATITELSRAWAANRPHRESSAARTRSLIDNHIAGTALGDMPVGAVRQSHVQAWATGVSKRLEPGGAKLALKLLRAVLNAAVEDQRIPFTPARRIALPRAEAARIVPLTVPQVRQLAEDVPDRFTAMVIAQAGLGLRVGELLALRPRELNFLGRSVSVEWQIEASTGRRIPPKTPLSRRVLPMPTVVSEALARHIEVYGTQPDDRLFALTAVRYQEVIRKTAAAAGLKATTHDLRHHYASVLLEAGESVVSVAERLGHDGAKLVLSTYGHLIPGGEERTRTAIDSAWSAPDVPRAAELGS